MKLFKVVVTDLGYDKPMRFSSYVKACDFAEAYEKVIDNLVIDEDARLSSIIELGPFDEI